ncbi:MAG: type IV pilus inner membrane component PilO [Planctomycetota bacterium]
MTSGLRKAVFFILLAGLACVAYVYMIKPANESLVQEKGNVEKKLAKLQELERATATAEDLNAQLKKMEQAIEYFESKLPPTSQTHTVLENVTVIAQKRGLIPKTIRALKRTRNRGYVEQPLKMELHGDFKSYYSFLLDLEKLERITKIRELSLKKKLKHEGQIEATFIISIFFQDTYVG